MVQNQHLCVVGGRWHLCVAGGRLGVFGIVGGQSSGVFGIVGGSIAVCCHLHTGSQCFLTIRVPKQKLPKGNGRDFPFPIYIRLEMFPLEKNFFDCADDMHYLPIHIQNCNKILFFRSDALNKFY